MPARRAVVLCCAAACISAVVAAIQPIGSAQRGTGTVRGSVSLRGGAGSQVVVYIDGPGSMSPPAPVRGEMRQTDLRFAPEFVVVPAGSTVAFPNDDRVFHNVFSLSRTRRFDLGLYRSGESRDVRFDRPGRVDVYCNIHPDMIAQILVLDTSLYSVTTSDGSFVIPSVPVGSWDVVAAQRYGESFRGTVVVRAGGVATIDVSLIGGERPRGHRRKDGSPYGRYQ